MSEVDDAARRAFSVRLQQLKRKVTLGLRERGALLRACVARLGSDPDDAQSALKVAVHRLRGIAGTYGYQDLSELAAELEQEMATLPRALIAQKALELAQAAERTSIVNIELMDASDEGEPPER